jgi:hypothetical protein
MFPVERGLELLGLGDQKIDLPSEDRRGGGFDATLRALQIILGVAQARGVLPAEPARRQLTGKRAERARDLQADDVGEHTLERLRSVIAKCEACGREADVNVDALPRQRWSMRRPDAFAAVSPEGSGSTHGPPGTRCVTTSAKRGARKALRAPYALMQLYHRAMIRRSRPYPVACSPTVHLL